MTGCLAKVSQFNELGNHLQAGFGQNINHAAWAHYLEDKSWGSSAAKRQNSVPKLSANLGNGRLVLQASLLKRTEGVCREDLCPLVAVVAGAVTSSKDMREAR